MENKGLTIKDAAESLGVSPDTIRRRIKLGQIKATKIVGVYGPQWVIDPDSLADTKTIYEAVPIKHDLRPEELTQIIMQATEEAAEKGAENAISRYMQNHMQELQHLREQVEKLEKQLQENEKKNIFKRLFNIEK